MEKVKTCKTIAILHYPAASTTFYFSPLRSVCSIRLHLCRYADSYANESEILLLECSLEELETRDKRVLDSLPAGGRVSVVYILVWRRALKL
jgi:hypothetical protein